MVKRKRGRPVLCIAFPQEVIDLLHERGREVYGPGGRGTSGGASRLVRAWVYEKLGIEPPAEWGETPSPVASYQRERRARLAAEQAARGGQAEDPFARLAGEALAATAQATEAQAAALPDQPDNPDQEGSPF